MKNSAKLKVKHIHTQERTARSGFTLAEMLAVVALGAILAGVGGGVYIGTYKEGLVRKAARDFLLGARYARITAIERQRGCRITLDTEEGGLALMVDELDEETGLVEAVPVRDVWFKPVIFGGDVKFEDVQIGSADTEIEYEEEGHREILFSPDGTSQSAVIQIGDGKYHYTVSILAATGRAKIHSGTAEDVEPAMVDLDAEE